MKLSFVVSLLVAASFVAYAQQAMPRMTSVDPLNGKKGDVIVVTGENLQKEAGCQGLPHGRQERYPVEVAEQTATSIKFKIPAKASRDG